MGVCTNTSRYSQITIPPTRKCPTKLGKKEKELVDWIEMNRSKVNHRVTELYETVLANPLSIKVINLNFIHLGTTGCQHLAELFPFCLNLTDLKLWKCKIGPQGAGFLGKTMTKLQHLQVLSLEENEIGVAGAQNLTDCIPYLFTLQELNVRSNDLQCEGIRLLTERLGCFENLTVLMLDDNDITSYGVQALLEVAKLQKVERLGLSYNRVTDWGAYSLIKCVGRLQNLKTLLLTGNLINEPASEELAQTFPSVEIL